MTAQADHKIIKLEIEFGVKKSKAEQNLNEKVWLSKFYSKERRQEREDSDDLTLMTPLHTHAHTHTHTHTHSAPGLFTLHE